MKNPSSCIFFLLISFKLILLYSLRPLTIFAHYSCTGTSTLLNYNLLIFLIFFLFFFFVITISIVYILRVCCIQIQILTYSISIISNWSRFIFTMKPNFFFILLALGNKQGKFSFQWRNKCNFTSQHSM